jgi:deazaflavin-dependent oxidoreductase (nitroreductase family)
MPSMTMPMMVGFMILFMAGFMILFMIVVHSIRSHFNKQHETSAHDLQRVMSVINWVIKMLLRIGVRITILGPMMLLTVRGRKTGKYRTIPVDVHEHDGRRFLIATHGEGNWVHNLRATGEGILSLGRSRQTFTAQELTPEAAGPVIKDVLGPLLASQGVRGSALRQQFGVTPDSPLNDFINAARSHPVFELGSPGKVSLQSEAL